VISFPGRVPPGRRLADPVSLIDLPATILDLVRGPDETAPLPGRSLAAYWLKPNSAPETTAALLAEVSKGVNTDPWLPITKGPIKSVIVEGMHYIRHSDNREELYDFERDVAESENLSERSEARLRLERLRHALDTLITGSARTSARSDAVLPQTSSAAVTDPPTAGSRPF
jgi:arylsulfatase A-like enzyme